MTEEVAAAGRSRTRKGRDRRGGDVAGPGLLHDLLRTVDDLPRRTRHGRLSLHDMLFVLITKVFFGLSSEDHCLFLELLHPDLRPTGRIPHRNSITNYMRLAWLRPTLEALVRTSSQPLILYSGVLYFIDSTPVLAPSYYMSKNRKTGKLFERREWFRLHMICDDLTGVVTAARADSKRVAEQKYFEVLIGETMDSGFHVEAIGADKNYRTKANVSWARGRGVQTYITVKKSARRSKNSTDPARDENYERARSTDAGVKRQFHRRSRIESVNSALKQKFGREVLNESDAGKYNEALCKGICLNLMTVIRCGREFGFTPKFERH
jgi:hypothetical protein